MSSLTFLAIALVVAVAGILVVVRRSGRGHDPDSAIAEFEREMRALAPREGGTAPHHLPGTGPTDPPSKTDPDEGGYVGPAPGSGER